MPRGVRGSGPAKKQPASAPVASAAPVAPAQPAATSTHSAQLPPTNDNWRPLGSVNVDSLSGEPLKVYAKRAGLRQADIDFLSEDRLRQNIKIAIANHFELLSE